MNEKEKQPFPFDIAKDDPLINPEADEEEFFRAMTEEEIIDYFKI